MDKSLRIRVELIFRTESDASLPSWVITKAITAVDSAILASERDDLILLRESLPDLPAVVFDAAEKRLSALRGSALKLESASSGSIVLVGVVTAVSLFVLQNTIGETVKEAWLGSDRHRQLKTFLVRNRSMKPRQIASKAESKLRRTIPQAPGVTAEVRVDPEHGAAIEITVPVTDTLPSEPPKREDFE